MTIRQHRRDRGTAESLQWALLMPVVLLCILGVIQAGVLLHARNTVRQAAMAAAEAQALAGASHGSATAVVDRMTARSDVTELSTRVSRSDGMIRVEVTGRVKLLLGGSAPVSSTAVMPVEEP